MAIHKLSQGQTLQMTVTGVERDVPAANPRYGPSHKFVGRTATDPDACVFMTPASALRQLGRINLTLDTVVGQTIEFAKPGEYLDINLPSGTPTSLPATSGQSASAPASGKQAVSIGAPIAGLDTPEEIATAKVEQWKRLCGLHKRCLAFVLETEVTMLDDTKQGEAVGASPESVSALTAQLFIAATQAGLHR